MTIPFIYHQGDYIEAEKENSNHQYLNDLTLKNHNHSIYGDGGQLENTVNSGTFTTDTLEVVSGLDLTTTLGYVEDGGYIFDSSRFNSGQWYTLQQTPSGSTASITLSFGNFPHLSGLYPQILQFQIANGSTNPPSKYEIVNIDNYNAPTYTAQFRGYGSLMSFRFEVDGDIITYAGQLTNSRNAGTHDYELTNPIYRVVIIYGGDTSNW